MPRLKKSKQPKDKFEVYAAYWVDAVLSDDDDNPVSPVPAITFGCIRKKLPNQVQVGGEVFADGSMRLVTSIPIGMGVRVVKVGEIPVPDEFKQWQADND